MERRGLIPVMKSSIAAFPPPLENGAEEKTRTSTRLPSHEPESFLNTIKLFIYNKLQILQQFSCNSPNTF